MSIQTGLSVNDVMLVPRFSSIRSRFSGEIDLSVQLTPNIKLKYPIISAAMDTITGAEMANAMWDFGGLGIVHRFMSDSEHIEELKQLKGPKIVGLGLEDFQRLEKAYNEVDLTAVHIDVAYAYTPFMVDFIKEIKDKYPKLDVIVGSVATCGGVYALAKAGANAIRVGIGGGSRCSTSIQTGNGVPQITALNDVYSAKLAAGKVSIICDGGVSNAGDCVKCLAAGADAIMTGYLIAGSKETPGEVIECLWGNSDVPYKKKYRGMADKNAQLDWKGGAKSVEGVSSYVPAKGPVETVLQPIINNILSGFSYQGARNIKELQNGAQFIKITGAGMIERQPRE